MPVWVNKVIDIFPTPVARWVRSVGNALQDLGLSFILMFVLLIVVLFIFIGLTLLIVVLLREIAKTWTDIWG